MSSSSDKTFKTTCESCVNFLPKQAGDIYPKCAYDEDTDYIYDLEPCGCYERLACYSESTSADKTPSYDYVALGTAIGNLVNEKQAAYGDSFSRSGQMLKVLFPEGVKPEQYTDMLAIVRIIDKLFRLANSPDAFNESPGRDIAGYGLLITAKHEKAEQAK